MTTALFQTTATISDGYTPTGEYRKPRRGEFYLDDVDGGAGLATGDWLSLSMPILKNNYELPEWFSDNWFCCRGGPNTRWLVSTKTGPLYVFEAAPLWGLHGEAFDLPGFDAIGCFERRNGKTYFQFGEWVN